MVHADFPRSKKRWIDVRQAHKERNASSDLGRLHSEAPNGLPLFSTIKANSRETLPKKWWLAAMTSSDENWF